jgi:hypothetical protein
MEIIETSIFTKQITNLLSDDEYCELQLALVRRPDIGSIIPDTGGLRKLRWSVEGRGKRGGIRAIYYWFVSDEEILMLFAYPKSEQDNLTARQKKLLRRIVEEELR